MLSQERISEIAPCLACPSCKVKLIHHEDTFECPECNGSYPIRKGKLYFCQPASESDELDSIKGQFKKRFGHLYYYVLKPLIAPGFPFNFRNYVLKQVDAKKGLVIDLGSGNQKISEDVISMDFMDYDEIDIIADMRKLPFVPGSVDAFTSNGVLEHVADIDIVAEEVARATKEGGQGIHLIPFMYPFHASPHDYQRYTAVGAQRLFGPWRVEDQFASAGPFTLFNVAFLELLSILLSFGNEKLKGLVYLAFCPLVFPLKFLDFPFVRRESILTMAPNIVTHLRKPAARQD